MPSKHRYEQDFDATVVQYFAGRLSETARIAFEQWLQEDVARREQVERLRVIWEASAEVPPESGVDAALARVKQRIEARRASAAVERPVLKLEPLLGGARKRWQRTMWQVAAAVVVLVGAGVLWRLTPLSPPSAQGGAVHTYTTARGERATVSLSDGSTVMLHNESVLEVPVNFGNGARDVRLRGEGYFEIAHDPSRPFRVYARGALTKVLGTKFSVRARAQDSVVRVAVAEGRVAVGIGRIEQDAPVLTAGQIARLDESGKVVVQSDVDVHDLLSWTSGRLVFDRTPVPDVLAELSRWFDRDFVLGDSSIAKLKLTTVLGSQSLAEAVQVLETALDVRATADGRRIVLTRP